MTKAKFEQYLETNLTAQGYYRFVHLANIARDNKKEFEAKGNMDLVAIYDAAITQLNQQRVDAHKAARAGAIKDSGYEPEIIEWSL